PAVTTSRRRIARVARVARIAAARFAPVVAATVIAATFVIAPAVTATAQVVPGTAQAIGSMDADRARLAQLLGEPVATPASTTRAPDTTRVIFAPILPTGRLVYNSQIPYTRNDAEIWGGRGVNLSITGGGAATRSYGGYTLRAVFAPTLAYSQNLPFQFFR